MAVEDVFKDEFADMSDERFMALMKDRSETAKRNQKFGLIFVSVVMVCITAIVVTAILAQSGAFNG